MPSATDTLYEIRTVKGKKQTWGAKISTPTRYEVWAIPPHGRSHAVASFETRKEAAAELKRRKGK